jgi:hypothetical protein
MHFQQHVWGIQRVEVALRQYEVRVQCDENLSNFSLQQRKNHVYWEQKFNPFMLVFI